MSSSLFASDLETAKENVLPIKKGRDVAGLQGKKRGFVPCCDVVFALNSVGLLYLRMIESESNLLAPRILNSNFFFFSKKFKSSRKG